MAGGAVRVMNEVREAYGVVIPPFCRCAAAARLAKCRVTRQVPRHSPSSYQSPPPQKHAVRYGRAKYGARKLRQGGSGGKGHQRS